MFFIGHQKTVKILERSLKSGKISQAYLFHGPQYAGKFTLAKIFAACLIKNTTSLPNKVADIEINLPDLMVVGPEMEEKKGVVKIKDIKIEQVREARGWLATYPYAGKFKVLIINEAERMTASAQNSLLKILEEPNSTSIIILVAGETKNIIPTVKSRCQKFSFSSADSGNSKLEKEISRNLFGADSHKLAEKIKKIKSMSLNEKLDFAGELSKNAELAGKILDFWVWRARSEACRSGGDLSGYLAIEKIEKTAAQIRETNANARLALENLLISL